MKKLISLILVTVTAATAALAGTVSASAQTPVSSARLEPSSKRYSVIGEEIIRDEQFKFAATGFTKSNAPGFLQIVSSDGEIKQKEQISDLIDTYKTLHLPSDREYRLSLGINGFYSVTNTTYSFEKTGSLYQKVRFKIIDFASEPTRFNDDGSSSYTLQNESHNYNFTDEGDGHNSIMAIISGGAFTAVAPDKDGYVEAYVCTNLGEDVKYMMDFYYRSDNAISSSSFITASLNGLTIGDVTLDGYVSIDDATTVQKYIASVSTCDALNERNADANHDSILSIDDATTIQKYVANLL